MSGFAIVAACDAAGGIGKSGMIPWNLREDLLHFRKLTMNSVVIMGRMTWESINCTPLGGRVNIVVTSKPEISCSDVITVASLDDALLYTQSLDNAKVFIIGGAMLYDEALRKPECSHVYLTDILGTWGCDTFFPLDRLALYTKTKQTDWMKSSQSTLYRYTEWAQPVNQDSHSAHIHT